MNGNLFFDDLEDIILKAKPWLGPLMCPIDVPLTKMDSGMSPSTPWTRWNIWGSTWGGFIYSIYIYVDLYIYIYIIYYMYIVYRKYQGIETQKSSPQTKNILEFIFKVSWRNQVQYVEVLLEFEKTCDHIFFKSSLSWRVPGVVAPFTIDWRWIALDRALLRIWVKRDVRLWHWTEIWKTMCLPIGNLW